MCNAPLLLVTAPSGWRALRARLKPYGHQGVNESLRRGLTQAGIDYNWNPLRWGQHKIIHAIANPRTLQQALAHKAKGRAQTIVAGPNLAVNPRDITPLLLNPLLDYCIVPSLWVKNYWAGYLPALTSKLIVWAAGTNTNYWQPNPSVTRDSIIIYDKLNGSNAALLAGVQQALAARGSKLVTLRYGHYTPAMYRRTLQQAQLMIYLSGSESQGLALQEAWACNVPTLVYNPGSVMIDGDNIACSSAPYLTPASGQSWQTLDELAAQLAALLPYQPRSWVIANASDSVATQNYLAAIGW